MSDELNEIRARVICAGDVSGPALVSPDAISFYGGVDPDTGIVIEKGHALEGKSISGRILIFPNGKGSTVGSYILYRLKKNGVAPLGIINRECEAIVAVGAIISEIPTVDEPENDFFAVIRNGDIVSIDGKMGAIRY